MLKYQIIPVTLFRQNCTLLWCDETKKGATVDPGGDLHLIEQAVRENQVELERILLTHGHIDHIGGTEALASKLSLPIEGPNPEDKFWIDMLPQQSKMMGFPAVNAFRIKRIRRVGEVY